MLNYMLEKYLNHGCFTFRPTEKLQDKCNAPNNMGGVYLIYKVIAESEVLIYIGSSGRKVDGKIKVRKGGMRDRLVNGKHAKLEKMRRKTAFPDAMLRQGILEIRVYWWITYDDESGYSDFPRNVEAELMRKYRDNFGRKPEWHSE